MVWVRWISEMGMLACLLTLLGYPSALQPPRQAPKRACTSRSACGLCQGGPGSAPVAACLVPLSLGCPLSVIPHGNPLFLV